MKSITNLCDTFLIVKYRNGTKELVGLRNFLLYPISPFHGVNHKIKLVLAFIFPISSIAIGYSILKATYSTPSQIKRKIIYTLIGIIAFLGFGSIISVIQLLYILFLLSVLLCARVLGLLRSNQEETCTLIENSYAIADDLVGFLSNDA